MDRTIVYPLAVPLETDMLNINVDTMKAIGGILQMLVGGQTCVVGMGCTPIIPAGLGVTIAPGSITQAEEVDPVNAYSSLGTNSQACMKMGLSSSPVNLTLAAPSTAGYSQVYLVQVQFSETDSAPEVLPYINPANINQALAGPGGDGVSQNTRRLQTATLSLVAGVAATTGTQTAPAAAAGCFPLYYVTVANGQTAIVSSNIAVAPSAPFLQTTLSNILIPVPSGALELYMSPTGSDSNPGTAASAPLQTFVGAQSVMSKYALSFASAVINLAPGTYAGHNWGGTLAAGIQIIGTGGSTVTTIVGTGGVFDAPNSNAVGASQGANIYIQGLTLTATGVGSDYAPGGAGLLATDGGYITMGPDIVFGACAGQHMLSSAGSGIGTSGTATSVGVGYKVTGGAQYHAYAELGGVISVVDSPITIVGTPAFSEAFFNSNFGGYIGWYGNTVTGSATGTKYFISTNANVNTNGGGSGVIPGSSAGVINTGGNLT